MAGEWREFRLGEIAEIFDGPHATPKKTASGPIFLGISNLSNGRIDLTDAEHLSEADLVRWTRRVEPRQGDVVFSYETRLGEVALIPAALRCCLGRRMGLLRAKPGAADPRFLLYAYLGPKFQKTLVSRTVPGSTVDRIPLIEMPTFPISIPTDLSEQRAIARILGTLDDKIELNRRMNETLEAMARAIFKDWFVDFGPTRAKAEGRDPYFAENIWSQFPSQLDESEKPQSWLVGTLSDHADLNPESWTRQSYPSRISYVDLSGTKWGIIENVGLYRREDAPSRAQRILRNGDTIVGTVRPGNGSYAFISHDELTGSTGFAVLRPKKPNGREFVYLAATAPHNIDRLEHLADGGAYPAVRPEQVIEAEIINPSQPVLDSFAALIAPIFAKIESAKRENVALSELRDALLPKLISGEIRVKHAGASSA